MILEPVERPRPGWRDIAAAWDRHMASNAVIAWLFAITGPLAVQVSVASQAGLAREDIASWIFGSYAMGGLLSIVMSALYRQPIGMAWTIPGVVLIGPALGHLSVGEVAGACVGAGLLMIVLGLTGWVRRVMALLPMPIVMGMVCGVFLPFGLRIISGFEDSFSIALAIVAAWFVASAVPAVGRVLPPVLAALAAGIAAVAVFGDFAHAGPILFEWARPKWIEPVFSARAFLELVIPLTITVIGIHNPQGIAVLTGSNYRPPTNALTFACGVGSLPFALVGSVPACVAGPSNAIMCSSGRSSQRFVAGITYGVLMLAFGLAAPVAAQLSLTLPAAFIGVLGGLAMVHVLRGWMAAAFAGELGFGALVAFLVTLSGVTILNVGAAFWGLVFGVAASWLLERTALRKVWQGQGATAAVLPKETPAR